MLYSFPDAGSNSNVNSDPCHLSGLYLPLKATCSSHFAMTAASVPWLPHPFQNSASTFSPYRCLVSDKGLKCIFYISKQTCPPGSSSGIPQSLPGIHRGWADPSLYNPGILQSLSPPSSPSLSLSLFCMYQFLTSEAQPQGLLVI